MSMEPLTVQQEERILTEIGYSRDQLKSDLKDLREWMANQHHFPPSAHEETDIFYSNFLVGSKGSMETAKKKLDMYYSLREKGDVFTDRGNPAYLDANRESVTIANLEKNDPDGSRIYLAKLTNPEKLSPLIYFKAVVMFFEHRLRRDGILGREIYILDARGLSMSHVLLIPPSAFRSWITFFLEVYPLRVKKIIVANTPSVVAAAINNLFLPLVSKKIKERYIISKDSVEKNVDFVHLRPKDYEGGQGKQLETLGDEWCEALKRTQRELKDRFQEEVDEDKRPKLNGFVSNPHFGLHGSIKTLVID
uniref:Alpha-tocopherol transfer protein n=1 Tax=Lygus hesperus TaxID=30085 RepID=A0A0A9X8V8_LYGHE